MPRASAIRRTTGLGSGSMWSRNGWGRKNDQNCYHSVLVVFIDNVKPFVDRK